MKIHLKELRTKRKLSLRQLSELSGISKSEISAIESGQVMPTILTMCALARALRVKIWDLVDCDDISLG